MWFEGYKALGVKVLAKSFVEWIRLIWFILCFICLLFYFLSSPLSVCVWRWSYDSLHWGRCWYRWCWGCSGDGVRASLGLELGFFSYVFHYVFIYEHEYLSSWARNIRTYLARIPTWEQLDMNLPAHIITCQHHPWTYPLMAQHPPIQAKHHCQLKTTHTTRNLVHSRLARQPAPPGETGSDCLVVYVPPPGARFSYKSSLPRVWLADITSPPGASLCRHSFWVFDRLAHSVQPPSVVTVPFHSLILPLFQIIPHLPLSPR